MFGAASVSSSIGAKYIAFLDSFSRYTWFYLLKNKSEVSIIFKSFHIFAEKQTGFSIKAIQTDNAKKFLALKPYLNLHGIHHRLTCPHTHEQNGCIERKHNHIIETGLSMLATASLPMNFWGESFTATSISLLPTLCYITNLHMKLLFTVNISIRTY